MGAIEEAKSRFPNEKVKSACRASIKVEQVAKEEEVAQRGLVSIANSGIFVVMERKLAFLVDRRNYNILMIGIALAGLSLGLLLLLGPLTIFTLIAVVMVLIMMLGLEAFVWFQMRHASLIEFDRAGVSIASEPALRRIKMNGVKKGSTDLETYVISVTEGEEFPEL